MIDRQQFYDLHFCQWDSSKIVEDERIVREAVQQGLTTTQIVNATGMLRGDVISIRLSLGI